MPRPLRPTTPRARRVDDTRALLQVLVAYLVLILLVQAFAGAMARAAGPLHQHRSGSVRTLVADRFSHVEHDRAHARGQRHWHGPADGASTLPGRPGGADARAGAEPPGSSTIFDPSAAGDAPVALGALGALAAASALPALASPGLPSTTDPRRHVWRPHEPWALLPTFHTPPLRPPRTLVS